MIVKIAVIAIVGSLLAAYLKGLKPEYGQVFLIGLGIFLFYFLSGHLELLRELLDQLAGQISLSGAYIGNLIKMIGIAYVSEFASSLCKDAGCQTIASQVEMIGKMSMFLLSVPIMLSLAETVGGLF